jgi:L-ribulose-5-phosphate 4-epimerase
VTGSASLRAGVVSACRALADAGLVVLTFGNASALDREAGLVAIKPSGVPAADLRPQHIPVLELATGAVVSGSHRPSSDAPTHLTLLRAFPGAGGVVHTHSPYATAWAQACRDLPCLGTTHADHFRGAVPVTRLLTAAEIDGDYEERTGELIVETFTERELDPAAVPAVLVAAHGPFVWGDSLEEAVENAIALEAAACNAFRALTLAEVDGIPPALLARHFERKHGASAYYGQPQ